MAQLKSLKALPLRAMQLLHWGQGANCSNFAVGHMPVGQLQKGSLGTAGGGSKAPAARLRGKHGGAETKTVVPRIKKHQQPSIGEPMQNPFSSAILLGAALL